MGRRARITRLRSSSPTGCARRIFTRQPYVKPAATVHVSSPRLTLVIRQEHVATGEPIRGYGVAGRRGQVGGTLEIVQFGLIPTTRASPRARRSSRAARRCRRSARCPSRHEASWRPTRRVDPLDPPTERANRVEEVVVNLRRVAAFLRKARILDVGAVDDSARLGKPDVAFHGGQQLPRARADEVVGVPRSY